MCFIQFGQEILFAYTSPKNPCMISMAQQIDLSNSLQENSFFLNEVLKELTLFMISMKEINDLFGIMFRAIPLKEMTKQVKTCNWKNHHSNYVLDLHCNNMNNDW